MNNGKIKFTSMYEFSKIVELIKKHNLGSYIIEAGEDLEIDDQRAGKLSGYIVVDNEIATFIRFIL